MDPYLEQFWRDIHARCIIYAADELQAYLPGDLRDGQVNLVEIDLLRTGDRVLAVGASRIPASHRTLYQVCVYRAIATPSCYEVYRLPLRERLPVIGLPLRSTDPDVPLDLQAVIDQCYRNGGYDEDIDYSREPDPPLGVEDAHWADTLLREAGRR